MRFGEVLRKHRQESNRSINNVVDYMGWKVPYLMDIEKSRTSPPDIQVLIKLGDYLGIQDIDSFIKLASEEKENFSIKFQSKESNYINLAKALARAKGLTSKQVKEIEKILESGE